ncbi:MAG: hypothetical protein H6662_19965 [Ardenticatenaceae bacterium]|nr:hypothetical protein [Anaerolineales bacterium]MCB8923861.1 hypothetical protein [Ardenticatenaceae bacterium]MCB9003360.1 hypothetical protein [Ardenticatenaceae bacterium]
MLKKWTVLIAIILLLVLVGCSSPSHEPALGNQLLNETFDSPNAWETYLDDGVALQVMDGAYRVQTGDAGYIWGLNEQNHSDVVIEVEASQLSTFENNAYGVMCRSDTSNNGDGYYFLVSGDGYYAISKGEGEDVTPLVDWTSNSAINKGTATNTIRAVCVGDYLALYVNGKFMAETNDSSYANGYAGFAATAFEGGDTDISFDNLTIQEASLGE